MGNYRLRLSTLIPNSWIYTSITATKLKNKLTKTQPITTSSSSPSSSSSFSASKPATYQRKSYYFTRDLMVPDPITRTHDPPSPKTDHQPDPIRKSSKKKRPITPKKPIRRKSVSPELNPAGKCSCRSPIEQSLIPPNDNVYTKVNLNLPPIITKTTKPNEFGSGKWVVAGDRRSSTANDGVTRSPARKAKNNSYSPRLGNRVRINGINAGGRRRSGDRRSLSESMVVVKTTVDPFRDFKESMVEMIMGNNITSSKDLEDLLACYLSLNSDEYHDLIIKVFKEIWFECTDVRL